MPSIVIIPPMVLFCGTLMLGKTPFAILKPHSASTSASFAWFFIVFGFLRLGGAIYPSP